ncbi:high affinity copper uptake protein 1-like [Lingula anatina]|uniref:Copper transport protein n=1 Tax=Lingula anatina TaxID=7574 RepID=A0A1S3H6U1_LINAN|nr:high affinity copper uptake protein 1-like [Lingula anatina]|eukprot:XP_013381697.1 high affinity copper uptake protein 1-like [Lingula anatina]
MVTPRMASTDSEHPNYFHGLYHTQIYFKDLTISTWWGTLVSCMLLFLLAICYEGLKVVQGVYLAQTTRSFGEASEERYCSRQQSGKTQAHHENKKSPALVFAEVEKRKPPVGERNAPSKKITSFLYAFRYWITARRCICICTHLLRSCIHSLQLILGYFLMLAIMTYNYWYLLAVSLGAGLGYCLLYRKMVKLENIEEQRTAAISEDVTDYQTLESNHLLHKDYINIFSLSVPFSVENQGLGKHVNSEHQKIRPNSKLYLRETSV